MYGMSAFGLARQLGIGRGEAQDYIALYFSRYPGVRDFMDRTRAAGARATATSKPCSAAGCTWTNIRSRNQGQRAGAERAAINAPMQGTAADIIKRAMIAVDAWLQAAGRERALMLHAGARRTGVRGRRGLRRRPCWPKCRRGWRRPPNCGCRWWSIAGSATTGTRRTEPESGAGSGFPALSKRYLNRVRNIDPGSRTSNVAGGQLHATDAMSVADTLPPLSDP